MIPCPQFNWVIRPNLPASGGDVGREKKRQKMQKLREQVTLQTADTSSRFSETGLGAAISGRKMRVKLIAALGLAVVCAGSAIYLSNVWLESQFNRFQTVEAPQAVAPEKPKIKIVVAAKPLQYGVALAPGVIKEIEWPADAIPAGAFSATTDLITSEGARLVLTPMALNEPILKSKITNPGEAASLSAMLEDGYKAVTVRVDDVLGVAGLITPGDRVDVLWTRVQGQGARADETYTEVLLRGVRVLALDQTVDDGSNAERATAGFAKAVTIEVSTLQSQKVALATSTGKLFLALQHVAENNSGTTRRVTMSDLSARVKDHRAKSDTPRDSTVTADTTNTFGVTRRPASSTPNTPETEKEAKSRLVVSDEYAIVGVTRGLERSEYNVLQAVEPY